MDHWIRTDFKQMNSELESLYFEFPDGVSPAESNIKHDLVEQGRELIFALLKEGNTDEGFDSGFELLGDVGF